MRRKLKQIKPFAFLVAVSRCSLFSLYFQQHAQPANFDTAGQAWVVLNAMEARIKAKIEAVGTPLKDWGVQINYGIKTGYNDAFIIDEATKNKLIQASPKSAEIIRPILRGRDIKRYHTIDSKLWLIFTRRGTNIKNYPAIENYLLKYYEELKPKAKNDKKGRKPGSYKWYEIQDPVAFHAELANPKIVWGNLNNTPSFALDLDSRLIASPCVILVSPNENLKFLLAVLNSLICKFFVAQLSYSRDNGYLEYQKQFVEQLPIPKSNNQAKEQIENIVNNLIIAKQERLDTSEAENQIDQLVLELYNFNTEEKAYIRDFAVAG
jgi:adenine-specific DNA-methyltransferase